MSSVTLSQVVNESFINRFAGLAKSSSSSSSNPLKASSGGDTISTGLRYGARVFASAVQGINSAITVVNLSEAGLDRLDGLTDELIDVAKQATSASIGQQKREELNTRFRRLGKEFQEVVEETEVADKKILTTGGLSEYLQIVGLDRETSDSIAAVFDEFKVNKDDELASEDTKGSRPVAIPPGAYAGGSTASRNYTSVFDADISDRPSAYSVLNDLKAIKAQIKTNTTALEDAKEVIGKNLELVRAAGFAFLDLSSQITTSDDAASVAERSGTESVRMRLQPSPRRRIWNRLSWLLWPSIRQN
jgi:hypothetical protein